MRHLTTVLMASALLAIAAPAHAASNLECMDSGYDAQGTAAIDAFVAGLDFRAVRAPTAEFDAAIEARAQSCAASHGWNPAAQNVAMRYQRARTLVTALRRGSPVAPDALARIDAAIDATEPQQLRRTMQRMAAFSRGEGTPPDETDIATIMPIFTASGMQMNNDAGVFIGGWLASRISTQDLAAEFAAL